MEVIRSWEFNKELLNRNVVIILKIYGEFLKERLPSVDEIVEAIENLNRQIIAENCSEEYEVDSKMDELFFNGDFACMDMFVVNILDKCKHSAIVNQEFILGGAVDENDLSTYLINDCQNVLKNIIDDNNYLISQGGSFTQVFNKPDLAPKLEAGVS